MAASRPPTRSRGTMASSRPKFVLVLVLRCSDESHLSKPSTCDTRYLAVLSFVADVLGTCSGLLWILALWICAQLQTCSVYVLCALLLVECLIFAYTLRNCGLCLALPFVRCSKLRAGNVNN
jgi:hypothetical protein